MPPSRDPVTSTQHRHRAGNRATNERAGPPDFVGEGYGGVGATAMGAVGHDDAHFAQQL